jgi:hypothetical protein
MTCVSGKEKIRAWLSVVPGPAVCDAALCPFALYWLDRIIDVAL